jgi:hypothetical protein
MRMHHIVIWPDTQYKLFPHSLIKGTIFLKKVFEHKMCFEFLYNLCMKHFSFLGELSEIR